jgi:hypothetical protein
VSTITKTFNTEAIARSRYGATLWTPALNTMFGNSYSTFKDWQYRVFLHEDSLIVCTATLCTRHEHTHNWSHSEKCMGKFAPSDLPCDKWHVKIKIYRLLMYMIGLCSLCQLVDMHVSNLCVQQSVVIAKITFVSVPLYTYDRSEALVSLQAIPHVACTYVSLWNPFTLYTLLTFFYTYEALWNWDLNI